MGDGFLQLYKRLEAGFLSWPRTSEEAADLTEEQFRYLILSILVDTFISKISFPMQPGPEIGSISDA